MGVSDRYIIQFEGRIDGPLYMKDKGVIVIVLRTKLVFDRRDLLVYYTLTAAGGCIPEFDSWGSWMYSSMRATLSQSQWYEQVRSVHC